MGKNTQKNKKKSKNKKTSIEDAQQFLEAGSVNQAIRLFQKLKETHAHEADVGLKKCREFQKRKFWRNGDVKEFQKLTAKDSRYMLPLARLQGESSLRQVIKEGSEVDALLAECSLNMDVKRALLQMRRVPELKCIAEGWMAFLKGDYELSYDCFLKAKEAQPERAKIGMGLVSVCLNKVEEAEEAEEPEASFSKVRFFAEQRFPHFSSFVNISGKGEKLPAEAAKLHQYLQAEDVKEVTAALLSSKTVVKGWLSLRVGDLLFKNKKYKEAEKYWERAFQIDSNLSIDYQKRLVYQFLKDGEGKPKSLTNLYLFLFNQNKKVEARQFLEITILKNFNNYYLFKLYCPFIGDCEQPSWVVESPPIECRLFWFFQNATNNTGYDREDLEDNFSSEYWEKEVVFLYSEYGRNETFLRSVIKLGKDLDLEDMIRKAVFDLLVLSPQLEKEFLSVYETQAIKFTSSNYEQVFTETKQLLELFPDPASPLRQIYFLLIVNSKEKSEKFQRELPPSFLKIIALEKAIEDKKAKKQKSYKEFLPSVKEVGKEVAFDIFLFQVIAKLGQTTALKKLLGGYLKEICKSEKNTVALFLYLEQQNTVAVMMNVIISSWRKYSPHHLSAWVRTGIYFYKLEKYSEALKSFTYALRNFDVSGSLYQKLDDFIEECIEDIEDDIKDEESIEEEETLFSRFKKKVNFWE